MQTLLVLAMLVAAAPSLFARPPEPTPARLALGSGAIGPQRQRVPLPSAREYLLPRFLLPHFLGYDESPRMPIPPPRQVPDHNWLNKEIYRINQMELEDEPMRPYDDDLMRWFSHQPNLQQMFEDPLKTDTSQKFVSDPINTQDLTLPAHRSPHGIPILETQEIKKRPIELRADHEKKMFAFTPLEKGYYEPDKNNYYEKGVDFAERNSDPNMVKITLEDPQIEVIEPPRQIRQNPNLSRTKTLVTENIDKLRSGLGSNDDGLMDKANRKHIDVSEADPIDPLYIAAVGGTIAAAVSLTVFGFTFAWYTLAKKAKAAADVDYPAYGVTGPTQDSSGDRKLAHSAHMYHYQHQKQQIIAMENRLDLEQRVGSVSDPESEEENEEGDYTVYECPGFATVH